MFRKWLLMLLVLWIVPNSGKGNEIVEFEDIIDQIETDQSSEDVIESHLDLREELKLRPVVLNRRGMAELDRLYWLKEFQRLALSDYIRRTGGVESIYEIPYIHGFDQDDMEKLRPYVLMKHASIRSNTYETEWKSQWKTGYYSRHQWKGLQKGSLAFGPGFQQSMRLRWQQNPGQKIGAETLGGSYELKNIGALKQWIIGDYGLSFGQGLIARGGIFPVFGLGTENIELNNTLRPLAPSPGTERFRGTALRFDFKSVELTMATVLRDSQRYAINLRIIRPLWSFGIIVCDRGKHHTPWLSCVLGAQSGEQHLFTEAAYDLRTYKIKIGAYGRLPAKLKWGACGLLEPERSQADLRFEQTYGTFKLLLSATQTIWKTMRYRISLPCSETDISAQLMYQTPDWSFSWKLNKHLDQINLSENTPMRVTAACERMRSRIKAGWIISDNVRLNSEYQYCSYLLQANKTFGQAFMQELNGKNRLSGSNHLSYRVRCIWYENASFDCALYIPETDLMQYSSIGLLNGAGIQWNAHIAYTQKYAEIMLMYGFGAKTEIRCGLKFKLRN